MTHRLYNHLVLKIRNGGLMDSTHVVYDHIYLKMAALGESPDENARLNYTAGFLTGLNISKRFMDAKATTIMNGLWDYLSNSVDPIPSVEAFINEVERGTFGSVVLKTYDFVSIPRRFTREYGLGMKNATMLALVQVYRFYHYRNSETAIQHVLVWVKDRMEEYDR